MSKAMKQIKKMGGLKGLASMFGKGGLDAAMPGLGGGLGGGMGGGAGLPGLGAGGPDLSKFLKK
jgi:signal recognition particle subunit SRP54